MALLASGSTRIVTISRGEFFERFGNPNVVGAICGYTREDDTRAVLTLLSHARPRRVLEIGTGPGHMTANLTRWTPQDARVFTIDLVRGMPRVAPVAVEQQVEVPAHSDWGRFANHFGMAHKAFFITADTMAYDFGRIAPLDFAFIDGGHDLEHVLNDSRKTYNILSPGGLIVWHDFNSPVPWVKVREAIEQMKFDEPVVHVEGTEVAFLIRGVQASVGRVARTVPVGLRSGRTSAGQDSDGRPQPPTGSAGASPSQTLRPLHWPGRGILTGCIRWRS